MKQFVLIGVVLFTAVAGRAAGDFLATVTPEERAAMGLAKLTPEELARLETVVQRYKAGEVAVVRAEAARAKPAPTAAAAKEDQRKSYWAFLFGEVDTSQFVVESTLPGEFSEFHGRPTFKLANGQQWKTVSPLDYVCNDTLKDPVVTVKPGALSAFWLEIKGGPRVKVSPVRRE